MLFLNSILAYFCEDLKLLFKYIQTRVASHQVSLVGWGKHCKSKGQALIPIGCNILFSDY